MSFAEQLAARAAQQRRGAAPSPETARALTPPAAPASAETAAPASATSPRSALGARRDGAIEDGRCVSFEAAGGPHRSSDARRRGGDQRLLRAENKKLRMEALLLKAKLELCGSVDTSTEEDAGRERAAEARAAELQTRCEQLELRLQGEELQRQQLTSELTQVTELKNTEIEVLRTQLNRAEKHAPRTGPDPDREWSRERAGLRDEIRRLNAEIGGHKDKGEEDEEVRAGLRDEIRRLNVEISGHKDREEEDEEISFMSRYNQPNKDWIASQRSRQRASQHSHESDRSDVASLQSIIAMMRQTIDQTTQEKDLLERRLGDEQARSQLELQAFARTLAGVDDLRTAAEGMSREIRRIRVRGCRPQRSELPGGLAGLADGARRRGDLTAAVAASDAMEDALRVIEGHSEGLEEREERRRTGGAAGTAAAAGAASPRADPHGRGPLAGDGGGGFLNFWRRADGNDTEDEGPEGGRRDAKKMDKKSKHKQKRRGGDSGSVLTSFF